LGLVSGGLRKQAAIFVDRIVVGRDIITNDEF
jgi:hypothetical protein